MKQSLFRLTLGLAAVALLAACGGGGGESTTAAPTTTETMAAAVATAASGSGSITGLVSYSGEDTDAAINMDADPVCSSMHEAGAESETIVASDGNLANAFVYVKEGVSGSYPVPADTVVLDQKGCTYAPHVSGIQTGQKLVIRNSDPTLHNVHALPVNNPEFNQGQPFQNMELEKTFSNPEVMVRFKCDVHPWMASYMGVARSSVLRRHRRGRLVHDRGPAGRRLCRRVLAREPRREDAERHRRRRSRRRGLRLRRVATRPNVFLKAGSPEPAFVVVGLSLGVATGDDRPNAAGARRFAVAARVV